MEALDGPDNLGRVGDPMEISPFFMCVGPTNGEWIFR